MQRPYTDTADSVQAGKCADLSDGSDSGVEMDPEAGDLTGCQRIDKSSLAEPPETLPDARLSSELVNRAVIEYRNAKDSAKSDKAKALSTDPLTPTQLSTMKASVAANPHFLGRVAARCAGNHQGPMGTASNGATGRYLIRPGASTEQESGCRGKLEDLLEGELVYMCGKHLQWHNIQGDQLTSFSVSLLFLVVCALQKRDAGAREVTVQLFDTRAAQRPDGSPCPFYSAAMLYKVFDLKNTHPAPGWLLYDNRTYTHEFLGQGDILLKKGRLRPALIQDLEEAGLLDLLPTFGPESGGEMPPPCKIRDLGFPVSKSVPAGTTVYDGCVEYEKLTKYLLETARKVALCFVDVGGGEPPLPFFLLMLSFRKRWREEEVSIDWIKEKYSSKPSGSRKSIERLSLVLIICTGSDLVDVLTDSGGNLNDTFTHTADNLPECMQYLNLVRDCCVAFALPVPRGSILRWPDGATVKCKTGPTVLDEA